MPTEPHQPTLYEVVRRAVEVCELGPLDEPLEDLERRFEDADVPVHGIEDVPALLDEELGAIDVDWEDSGSLSMARAVIVYLAFRRDELEADPRRLLRLAARAEFDGEPPPHVRSWLEQAGVEL